MGKTRYIFCPMNGDARTFSKNVSYRGHLARAFSSFAMSISKDSIEERIVRRRGPLYLEVDADSIYIHH